VHHANAAVADDKIYVLGALHPNFEARGEVWIYESGADSWTEGAPMTPGTERGGGAAVALNGKIHVLGGLRDGGEVAMHSVYDPDSDTWSQLEDMPTARDHLAAGEIDGVIYAVGGRDSTINGHYDVVEAWDGTGWTTVAPMPTSRGGIAAAVLDGRLYVFGGEGADNARGVFEDNEVYDPVSDSWESLDPMPTPRHGTGAVAVDGRIWIPAGADQVAFGAVAVNEAYAP
jgi:N-acetylneuraminic acid mutarotase